MSKQIADIVLFWSEFSKESLICVKFVSSYKLPVEMVKLDTAEARENAMNGELVKISTVPSLLVSYISGEVNVYEGRPKIIAWFQAMIARSKDRSNPQNNPRPQVQSPRTVTPRRAEMISEPEEDYMQETEIPEEPEITVKKAGRKKQTKKASAKSLKKKPAKIVKDIDYIGEDDNEGGTELIMEDAPRPKLPPIQSKGFATGAAASKKADNSLMLSAKKMMAEREGTLGYGEKQYG